MSLPWVIWKCVWPNLTLGWLKLTLYWCDVRVHLCLDVFIVSWWMHGCNDNHKKCLWLLTKKMHVIIIKSQIKNPFLEKIWSRYWLPLTMVANKTRPIMCEITKKVKIQPNAWIIGRLSYDNFTIKVLYFTMIHFKGSNIEIYWIKKFIKILNLIISIILGSLLNFKCHLGELVK